MLTSQRSNEAEGAADDGADVTLSDLIQAGVIKAPLRIDGYIRTST